MYVRRDETIRATGEQFENIGGKARMLIQLKIEPFVLVHFGLAHEHFLVEKVLQAFVSEVDAELLEAVLIKNLETVNVQNSNETMLLRVDFFWDDEADGALN